MTVHIMKTRGNKGDGALLLLRPSIRTPPYRDGGSSRGWKNTIWSLLQRSWAYTSSISCLGKQPFETRLIAPNGIIKDTYETRTCNKKSPETGDFFMTRNSAFVIKIFKNKALERMKRHILNKYLQTHAHTCSHTHTKKIKKRGSQPSQIWCQPTHTLNDQTYIGDFLFGSNRSKTRWCMVLAHQYIVTSCVLQYKWHETTRAQTQTMKNHREDMCSS